MADENWAHAFSYVLMNEGGYVNAAGDAGGPTMRGITLATLASWRGKAVTEADVRALSLSETAAIYKALYWDKLRCGALSNEAVATCVVDAGVNTGPAQATKVLQATLGVLVDGQLGPKTIEAANGASVAAVVTGISQRQQAFYVGLALAKPALKVFLPTWLKRAALYQAMLA